MKSVPQLKQESIPVGCVPLAFLVPGVFAYFGEERHAPKDNTPQGLHPKDNTPQRPYLPRATLECEDS